MIINNLANIINTFILELYSSDIKFYQIIMGMFIFDFLIYIICKLIKEARKSRLY